MKKLAIIALLATQAFAFNSQAYSESKSLLFCNLQNASGQAGAIEVFKSEAGVNTVQISILGRTVLREEVQSLVGNQHGHKIVSNSVKIETSLKQSRPSDGSTSLKANGAVTATVLGGAVQNVICEYPL